MGRNNQGKYSSQRLLPYVPPMVPQATANPAPAGPATSAPATPQAPLFNIVPVFNSPVRTVAQPSRQGQPTRRALLERLSEGQ